MLGEIYLICTLPLTFHESSTFFKVPVTVARWPKAPVLPTPKEYVNGSLGFVQWVQP